MRDLWISLNEKYQRNKSKIWFAIAVVVFFILVTRNIGKMPNTSGGSSNETATSESGYSNSEVINAIKSATSADIDDSYNSVKNELGDINVYDENVVKLFIEMCNNKKFGSAYEMLSDDCKNILYPTKEAFVKSYGNVIFDNYKNYSVKEYKGNTYRIDFKEDAITTGGITDSISPEYITIVNDGKINISGFISKKDLSIKANNPYFSTEITGKIVYVDHEVYQIKIKNIVKADIYINETMNNGLYIVDSNGNRINIATDEYIDQEYLVPSETTKTISLIFNKNYNNSIQDKSINFGNIKIVNKSYYNYEIKDIQITKYPERTTFEMNIQ